MSLTITEIEDENTHAAKRLAGKPWHTLSKDETSKVIVLQATTDLLGSHRREAGADEGFVLCTVGNYTGQQ